MSKIVKILILVFIFSFSIPVVSQFTSSTTNQLFAQDHHKKKHKRTKSDGRKKDVHVKGYTTKKGKHVHSYNRRHPKRH